MTERPYEMHLCVCTQEKPDGLPSCAALGGKEVHERLRAAVAEAGLLDRVHVSTCGCVGLCQRGPNVVAHPSGRWYTGLRQDEVTPLVQSLAEGRPLEGREDPPPETIRREVAEHRQKVQRMQAAARAAGALPPELQDAIRAFMPSRAILSAVELDLFTAVHAEASPAAGGEAPAIARRLGADPRGTESLLNALVALGLLEKREGRFRNAPWADTFLREGAAHDSRAALGHTIQLWRRWSTLTDAVRAGTALELKEMVERGEQWTVPFIASMHKHASERAPQLVGAIDLRGVSRVLDLGGGSGAYSIAFAKAKPDLTATVFDLPTVTPLTRQYAEQAGVAERVLTVSGDLRADSYGEGFDLVYISAIAHMLSPEENLAMLRKAKAALRPGGRVVVQDFLLSDDKTSPRTGALFALNMLVGTQAGSAYSRAEYASWLEQAGLRDVKHLPLPGPTALMIGVG